MIYEYYCEQCQLSFDVVKSVNEYNREECCACGKKARKIFSIAKPIVDKTEPEYYPSLGTIVKSKAHRRNLIKERGLVEVGNEKPETVRREMDKTLNDKIKKQWEGV